MYTQNPLYNKHIRSTMYRIYMYMYMYLLFGLGIDA